MPRKTSRHVSQPDSADYLARKRAFERLLQVYGRKPVLDALRDPALDVERVHLAPGKGRILQEIRQAAAERGCELRECDAAAVSRISRNGKQDQGVVADLRLPHLRRAEDFLADPPASYRLLAVDGVTTPANLGLLIRSLTASALDGLLLPRVRTCGLGPLVIKASAGTLFRCPILRCADLERTLPAFRERGAELFLLDAAAATSCYDHAPPKRAIYLLGGESEGVSQELRNLPHEGLSIPLRRGVESLNVASAASVLAFELSRKIGP